jgi:adenylate cyclase
MLRYLLANRHRRWSLLFGFSITTIVILANLTWGGISTPWKALLDALEMKTIDWRYQLRGPRPPPPDVLIAAVDDQSIQAKGRWPWPRRTLAALTDKLTAMGVRAIVFDMFFTEPEGDSAQAHASDARLVAACRRSGRITQAWIGYQEPQQSAPVDRRRALAAHAWPLRLVPGQELRVPEFAGAAPPLAPISDTARALGFGNVSDCGDGVYRWYTLVARHDGALYPSLALAVAATDLRIDPRDIALDPGRWIRLGDQGLLPLIGGGAMFLDFYGPQRTIPHRSVADILDGRLPPGDLAGKIVIVGETARGSTDIRATPFGADYYGVELQATAIANLLAQRYLRASSSLVDIAITGAAGLALGLLLSLLRPLHGAVVSLLVFLGYNVVCIWMFVDAGYLLPMAAPNVAVVACVLAILLYRLSTEERQRSRITETFGLFVPPQVVEELTGEEAHLSGLQAERREITVLFADIRDFTAYAEHRPPEDVVALLNRYFTLMHEVVWEHGGTLDKYMGDGLLAFFGAPTHQEDHAERAVLAAVEMQRQIAQGADEWRQYGMENLRVGMGLDTGEALVGFAGSAGRMQYTCMGTVVNLASRLEEENRLLDTDTLISAALYERVKALVEARPVGDLPIRGLSVSVAAYELLGRRQPGDEG